MDTVAVDRGLALNRARWPALPASEKDTILQTLCRWATKTFGDLQSEVISEEAYVLQGVRLRSIGRG